MHLAHAPCHVAQYTKVNECSTVLFSLSIIIVNGEHSSAKWLKPQMKANQEIYIYQLQRVKKEQSLHFLSQNTGNNVCLNHKFVCLLNIKITFHSVLLACCHVVHKYTCALPSWVQAVTHKGWGRGGVRCMGGFLLSCVDSGLMGWVLCGGCMGMVNEA